MHAHMNTRLINIYVEWHSRSCSKHSLPSAAIQACLSPPNLFILSKQGLNLL